MCLQNPSYQNHLPHINVVAPNSCKRKKKKIIFKFMTFMNINKYNLNF